MIFPQRRLKRENNVCQFFIQLLVRFRIYMNCVLCPKADLFQAQRVQEELVKRKQEDQRRLDEDRQRIQEEKRQADHRRLQEEEERKRKEKVRIFFNLLICNCVLDIFTRAIMFICIPNVLQSFIFL